MRAARKDLVVEPAFGLEELEVRAVRRPTPEVHVRDLKVAPDCLTRAQESERGYRSARETLTVTEVVLGPAVVRQEACGVVLRDELGVRDAELCERSGERQATQRHGARRTVRDVPEAGNRLAKLVQRDGKACSGRLATGGECTKMERAPYVLLFSIIYWNGSRLISHMKSTSGLQRWDQCGRGRREREAYSTRQYHLYFWSSGWW
jgi:hypothetical protein